MAFDAKQAVIDKLTHLADQLKQAKEQQASSAEFYRTEVANLEAEIDGWQKLLSGSESKPTAKKTAAKK